MPIDVKVEYVDGRVEVVEPEPTFEEVVELYGKEMVRKEFIDNLRYRNKHPRVYRIVSQAVEKWCPHPVKREVKDSEGKTTKKLLVSDIEHVRAAMEEDEKTTADIIKSVAISEPLYVRGSRGDGKISDRAMQAANNVFSSDNDDEIENTVKSIETFVQGYRIQRDPDGEVSPEGLARGIMALQRQIEKNVKEQVKQQTLQVIGTAL